jgi:Domain of unknown function (DUF5753)
MRYSDSKISRFESGQLPDFHALTALLDLYGLTAGQRKPIAQEWERAKEPGWWAGYRLADNAYVSMEDEAMSIRQFDCGFIPGLLQTDAYARAAFAKSATSHTDQWVDRQVEVRLFRQHRLGCENPLLFDVIIQEGVLRRRDVEPSVHRAQLRQIIERAGWANVTVRVIPEAVGTHDGLLGSLTLLTFPDEEDLDVVYTEHAFGAHHTDDASQVAAARLRLDHLAQLSLDPGESIRFIEQVVDTL